MYSGFVSAHRFSGRSFIDREQKLIVVDTDHFRRINMVQIGFCDAPATANVPEACGLKPRPEFAVGYVFPALAGKIVPKFGPVQCHNHCVIHRLLLPCLCAIPGSATAQALLPGKSVQLLVLILKYFGVIAYELLGIRVQHGDNRWCGAQGEIT